MLEKVEAEEQPSRYADFVSKVLEQALREESDPEKRLAICNIILDHLWKETERDTAKKPPVPAENPCTGISDPDFRPWTETAESLHGSLYLPWSR